MSWLKSSVPSAPGKRSGAQITAKLHTTCDNLIIVNTLWEVVVVVVDDDDDDGGGGDDTDTDTDTAHIDDSKANSQTKNDGFMADEWLSTQLGTLPMDRKKSKNIQK